MEKGHFPGLYDQDSYDRDFNLLYLKINPTNTTKSGLGKSKTERDLSIISNLAIYDIGKEKLVHFFEQEVRKSIQYIFYETSYDKVKSKMVFNHENYYIFNNYAIEERAKSDTLFLFVVDENRDAFEFWISTRSGENKRMLKSFSKGASMDWKIDVFNQKILFIETLEKEIQIESFDWDFANS